MQKKKSGSGGGGGGGSGGGGGARKAQAALEEELRAMAGSPDDKLAAACQRAGRALADNARLKEVEAQLEEQLVSTQKERDHMQVELHKAMRARTQLESLCRELQKQNKAIKDENLQRIREEEARHREMTDKFQKMLAEVSAQVHVNNSSTSQLRDDNCELQRRFQQLVEQQRLRDQQVEKMSKQLELETQLHNAQMAELRMQANLEKEQLLREKQQLLNDVMKYEEQVHAMEQTEENLRSQLALYAEKFDDFQTAMTRSTSVFNKFKEDMEKMSKKITQLEKETASWRSRWEKSHESLQQMAGERDQQGRELERVTRQSAQLEKLCRTLQAERQLLMSQLAAVPGMSDSADPVPEVNMEAASEGNMDPVPESSMDAVSGGKVETAQEGNVEAVQEGNVETVPGCNVKAVPDAKTVSVLDSSSEGKTSGGEDIDQ
ncbi:alpha-taxilin [Schistocerca serialis cubense]|uniref:alpha-taxilin n=1 Tax=Schistocerca serialis cubense TaxID=2023355 RepID=UPI00214EA34F|nr:alpha-taxilin [Schistocerca serialis cubense]